MLKGTNLQEGATMIDRNNQIGGIVPEFFESIFFV